MKALHWVLLAAVLAGGGFAVYWFGFRKKPSVTVMPGSPYYTPPQPAQKQVTTAARPAPAPKQQSLSQTLQQTTNQIVTQAATQGINLAASKGIEALGNMFSSWGSSGSN